MIPDLQAIIWGYFERKQFMFTWKTPAKVSNPWGLCVDKDGSLYASDSLNHKVHIFTWQGFLWKTISSGPPGSLGEFAGPTGICCGPDGSIYICGCFNDAVVVYQPDGKYLREMDGTFNDPSGVAVSADGSLVYVADKFHVSVFTSDGKFSHYLGGTDSITPCGVAVGPDGNIYVSDYSSRCVQVYSPSGQHVRQIGRAPSTPQVVELVSPVNVAVSSRGLVYIADTNTDRVQVFNATGTFLYNVTGLAKPSGVAVTNSGKVYACMKYKSTIVAFRDRELDGLSHFSSFSFYLCRGMTLHD